MANKQKHKTHDVLKLIAIVTMLIDHIGFFFYPKTMLFRAIGRIAFPIFAYHLAMGYRWTSNKTKYAGRLLLFALITQTPYLVFSSITSGEAGYNPLRLNILFLLFIGIILLFLYERLENSIKKYREKTERQAKKLGHLSMVLVDFIMLTALLIMPEVLAIIANKVSIPGIKGVYSLRFSYGTYGLLLILLFFKFHKNMQVGYLAFVGLTILDIGVNTYILGKNPNPYIFQSSSVIGVVLIYALKDLNLAFRMPKWFAYWFYPIHLAILGLIDYFDLI